MSVWMFFFDRKQWDDLYVKNCTLKTNEEWYASGNANVPLGMLYATIGIICEIIYIPFMIAMLKPEFIQYSCYKLMFLIGAIDVFVVPCNAIITGIQCALGLHFCTNPVFYFFVGAIGSYGFYGVTLSCCILAIDRFLEICFPQMAILVFGGKRIFFWLALPIVYIQYNFCHLPFLYNTKRFAYFTDPFMEIQGMQGNPAFKQLTFHCIHNITTAFSIGGIYTALIIVVKIKTMMYENVTITKLQKSMTLQSMCICIEMFIACLVYVYNQFLPLPNIIEIIAQVSWIGVHGDTPIVYLLLNASLREAVFKMVLNLTKRCALKIPFVSQTRSSVAPLRREVPEVNVHI